VPEPAATGANPLVVGVPTEVKNSEHRVAITPDGVRELGRHGVEVLVQAGAGEESSIDDGEYVAAGAAIAADPAEVWGAAGLVCKVKEPQGEELGRLRPDLVLFTYLHLAAYPEVADALVAAGTAGVAYETVQN
jgi:alanine dehydrogenase